MTTPPPPQGQNPHTEAPTAPMGQQAGQPGAPQQPYPPQAPYAPFPQQQGAPVPPPVPPKSGGKKARGILGTMGLIAAAVLVKLGIGWLFSQAETTDAETTSVGACLHNKGTDSKADLKEVDCSSGEAEYKVVEKFDGSSDENKCESVKGWTVSYVQSGGGHDVVLCLTETK
ncbi:hypothetical protein [Streptomyces sp. NPDC088816]|uniref:LppU/SCO3897 family protein n=1 Tax=Streptomyces sp. NPDC088816 TaxID=3365906 RepID=UPI003803F585